MNINDSCGALITAVVNNRTISNTAVRKFTLFHLHAAMKHSPAPMFFPLSEEEVARRQECSTTNTDKENESRRSTSSSSSTSSADTGVPIPRSVKSVVARLLLRTIRSHDQCGHEDVSTTIKRCRISDCDEPSDTLRSSDVFSRLENCVEAIETDQREWRDDCRLLMYDSPLMFSDRYEQCVSTGNIALVKCLLAGLPLPPPSDREVYPSDKE